MNKQLRTLVVLVMAALMACPLFTQAADRAHTLKVYNWADYIDMDNVLNNFPAWYKEQTGEDVEIIYQTFDINESMLTEIEIGHEDYDVICPSEYIIERMLRRGLLQPINKDFGSLPDYTKLVAPFAQEMFQQMVAEDKQEEDKLDIKEWAQQGKAIDLHKSKLGTIKPTHENPYKYAYYTNMPLRVSEALIWEKTIAYSRLKSQFAKPYLLHKVYF